MAILYVCVTDVAHNGFDRVGARSQRTSVVHETDCISKEIEEVCLSVKMESENVSNK